MTPLVAMTPVQARRKAADLNLKMTKVLNDLGFMRPELQDNLESYNVAYTKHKNCPDGTFDFDRLPAELVKKIVDQATIYDEEELKAYQARQYYKNVAKPVIDAEEAAAAAASFRAIAPENNLEEPHENEIASAKVIKLFGQRQSMLLVSRTVYNLAIQDYIDEIPPVFVTYEGQLVQTHFFDATPTGFDPLHFFECQNPLKFDTRGKYEDMADPVGPIARLEKCLSTRAGFNVNPTIKQMHIIIDLRQDTRHLYDNILADNLRALYVSTAAAPNLRIGKLTVHLLFTHCIRAAWLILIKNALELINAKDVSIIPEATRDILLSGDMEVASRMQVLLRNAVLREPPTSDSNLSARQGRAELMHNIVGTEIFGENPQHVEDVADHIDRFLTRMTGHKHPSAELAYTCRFKFQVLAGGNTVTAPSDRRMYYDRAHYAYTSAIGRKATADHEAFTLDKLRQASL